MATIEDIKRLVALDHGLASLSTLRGDGTVQSTVVNAGMVDHPVTGTPVAAFVGRDDATNAPTAQARAASLPDGWRPWRTALRQEVKGAPLDYQTLGCVTNGTALYCGGTGFTVARIDPASGRTLWRHGTRPQGVQPIGVRDGLVYAYEDPDDKIRRVVALDAATGHRYPRPDEADVAVRTADARIRELEAELARLKAAPRRGGKKTK